MTEETDINNLFICSCGQPSLINNYLTRLNTGADQSPKNDINIGDGKLNSKIKAEFMHYCRNSTIRGVPRIAKSRNKPMRTLWISSFISLLLGFSICLYLLGAQFFDYDVIHPPRVLKDTDSDFPAITLCNARPLSSGGKAIIQQNNWRKPNEFTSLINQWAIKEFFTKNRTKDYNFATYAMQLSSYLESLPTEEDRMSLGHKIQDFVIYCQVNLFRYLVI